MNTGDKFYPDIEYYSPKVSILISILVTLVPFLTFSILSHLHHNLYIEELLFDASFHLTIVGILVDTPIPLYAITTISLMTILLNIFNARRFTASTSIPYTVIVVLFLASTAIFSSFLGVGTILSHKPLVIESYTQVTDTNYNDFVDPTYTDAQLEEAIKTVLNTSELPTSPTTTDKHNIVTSLCTSYCKLYNRTSQPELDYFRSLIYSLPSVQNFIKSDINTTAFPLRIVERMANSRLYSIDNSINDKLTTYLITYWVDDVLTSTKTTKELETPKELEIPKELEEPLKN